MQHFNSNFLSSIRKLLYLFIFTLCFVRGECQVFPIDTIMRHGERPNRINLVYLGDGYTAAQVNTFVPNATTINDALFSQTPFVEYKNFFNAYAIKSPSTQSGAKHPGNASDEGSSGGQPITNPDNYYQSTFDYFSIHRLLVPQNGGRVNGALASNLPDYDQAFIVVNSSYYGGSGGSYATASTDPSSAEVAIHELGHSFAGLADEYWAGDFYAGEKPNMTANSNPATVKWKNWVNINGIGVYPYGPSAPLSNWFRPHQTCKMQYLNYPFCSVCSERIIDRIHELVNLVDSYTPVGTSFTLANTDPVNFSIAKVLNNPSTIEVKWYLNGAATPFATNQDAVTIPFANLNNGNNTVRAEVTDKTSLSKSYLPAVGYVNNLTWTVNKPAALPVHLKSFSGKVLNKEGILNWEIDDPKDLKTFELEKSRDGNKFSLLTTIAGEDLRKNYTYTDKSLFFPYSYYRLKTIEKSGSVFFSSVVRLQNAFEKLNYKVYQDAELRKYHLSCAVATRENISVRILDASGKQVYRKSFQGVEQQLEHDIELQGKAAGIYFMNITIGKNNYTVQLLAK
jgi:hypothetical protein